jgi:hypothetical protein
MVLQAPVAMQDKTIKFYKMKKIFTMCLGLVLLQLFSQQTGNLM